MTRGGRAGVAGDFRQPDGMGGIVAAAAGDDRHPAPRHLYGQRDQIALSVRIAGMWEEEFLKPEKAAERLERVLEIDPTHIQA